jgi:hypothetical protein
MMPSSHMYVPSWRKGTLDDSAAIGREVDRDPSPIVAERLYSQDVPTRCERPENSDAVGSGADVLPVDGDHVEERAKRQGIAADLTAATECTLLNSGMAREDR